MIESQLTKQLNKTILQAKKEVNYMALQTIINRLTTYKRQLHEMQEAFRSKSGLSHTASFDYQDAIVELDKAIENAKERSTSIMLGDIYKSDAAYQANTFKGEIIRTELH